jgi:hypothetical protein
VRSVRVRGVRVRNTQESGVDCALEGGVGQTGGEVKAIESGVDCALEGGVGQTGGEVKAIENFAHGTLVRVRAVRLRIIITSTQDFCANMATSYWSSESITDAKYACAS